MLSSEKGRVFLVFFLQTTPVPFQRFPLETLVCSFVSHTGHDFGILFYGNRSRAKGEGAGRRRQRRLRPATRNWRRRRRRKRQVETLPDSFSASFQRLWARGGTDDFWRGHSGFPDRFFFFFYSSSSFLFGSSHLPGFGSGPIDVLAMSLFGHLHIEPRFCFFGLLVRETPAEARARQRWAKPP